MQARKQIENWLVWLAADAIYIPLYFVKALPLTGVLYSVFALMCVKGWRDWTRTRAAQAGRRWKHGAVIGKFLPFHTGHRHLIETALSRARQGHRDRRLARRRADPRRASASAGSRRRSRTSRSKLLDQDEVGLASDDTAGWAARDDRRPRRQAGRRLHLRALRPTRGRRRWAATTCSSTVAGVPCRSAAHASAATRSATSSTSAAAPAATTSSGSACSAPRAPARPRSRARSPTTTAPSGTLSSDTCTPGSASETQPTGAPGAPASSRDREAPELVRGLPRRPREPRALLRHERVDDRASSTRSVLGSRSPEVDAVAGAALRPLRSCATRRRRSPGRARRCAPTGPTAAGCTRRTSPTCGASAPGSSR